MLGAAVLGLVSGGRCGGALVPAVVPGLRGAWEDGRREVGGGVGRCGRNGMAEGSIGGRGQMEVGGAVWRAVGGKGGRRHRARRAVMDRWA